MDCIMFDAGNTAAASEIAEAVKAGSLWGVSMGTTSNASSYLSFVLIEATSNRVGNLLSSIPENVEFEIHYHEIDSFSESSQSEKFWYLRGKLSSEG